MPTFDFRARQLRVNQIINSGSDATDPLLVYGLKSATNVFGGYNASHFNYGSDTWMFVSGTARSADSAGSYGAVVLKGDLVTSGVIQLADLPGATSISTPASNKGTIYAKTGTLYFKNDAGSEYDLTTVGGGGGGSGNWNELSPSPRLNTTASVAIAGTLGSSYAAQNAGSDVFFFVSGTNTNRLSVFGGGVTLSGSLRIKDTSDNANVIITPQGVISGTNDVQAGGALIVAGNILTDGGSLNTSNTSATLFNSTATTVSIAGAASTINIAGAAGATSITLNVAGARTGPSTINLGAGATQLGDTKQINIGPGGVIGSETIIRLGTTTSGGTTSVFVSGSTYITGSLTNGRQPIANGLYSHAEGEVTQATGNYSHAEGTVTIASGLYSHAEGNQTEATNDGSHSEGDRTKATGQYSHAEGILSEAIGDYSHAEGDRSQAIGDYSHAAGSLTEASGSYSYAGGQGTITSGSYQHVVGRYNARNDSTSLFIVGNGLGSSDANRSDAFRVRPGTLGNASVEVTGSLWVTQNLTVSGSTNLGDSGSDRVYFNANIGSDIIPDSDLSRNVGSPVRRFANVYTGDLHLRNDRGDWTIIEEESFLRIVNNKTGKNFKLLMEPID